VDLRKLTLPREEKKQPDTSIITFSKRSNIRRTMKIVRAAVVFACEAQEMGRGGWMT